MDNQPCQTFAALEEVEHAEVRPFERRGRFVSYTVFRKKKDCPSRILFYVLVYEEFETTYSVPHTKVPEMFTRDGLWNASTPTIIYSKTNIGNVLGKIDNTGIQNFADPTRNMWFSVRNQKDCESNAYPVTNREQQKGATITGLMRSTAMKVRFHIPLDTFTKYSLILAAVKILYTEFRYYLTPMPTNLNISYGVDLPPMPPPPASLLSLTNLEALLPLQKCIYRVSAEDVLETHYSEILDFHYHHIIFVESTSRQGNLWLTHFNNEYGDAPFHCSREHNSEAFEVFKTSGQPLGYLWQNGKQIFGDNGYQVMEVEKIGDTVAGPSAVSFPVYHITLTDPNKTVIGEISFCQDIGQLVMDFDIGLPVEHKALLLASFRCLAVFDYKIHSLVSQPQIRYYPFRSATTSVPTQSPF